ncbi:MAG: DegV family protein [Oscillospiraceae bacterium]|nr:DegV family protein [Oscillospiraceae bacterium]
MNLQKFKIVSDSSSDILTVPDVSFSSAPLKIITADKEYIDDATLDVYAMAEELLRYKGKSSTACPSPGDWIAAFGDAQYIFCVTITSGLSGSYNAACIAKQQYEENNPGKKVFVIDSLSAGPELCLIIEKLREYILSGKEFDEICTLIPQYLSKTGLLFILESMRNLANNGRVNPIVAKAAGLLGIRAVGRASSKGTLELLEKCRGEQKAFSSILRHLGDNIKKVRIAHCNNESAVAQLSSLIAEKFKDAEIKIYQLRGLCSFYAEKGGLLVGYETI